MRFNRRHALAGLGAGALTPATASSQPSATAGHAFHHGVASGDPGPTSAIFWTRITPAPGHTADVDGITLEVATDPDFKRLARTSSGLRARAARDWTLKHDLDGQGLKPGTDYWYRFRLGRGARAVLSPVGRTRTLPAPSQTKGVADVVLAAASCSLHPAGHFNAYAAIAALPRVDAVLHLGDYIYEYGAEPTAYGMDAGQKLGRVPEPPHEIVTLADYRLRHAQYKRDPDLQAAHARAPWIVVWDDHEVTNDGWLNGAQNHQPETEGDWQARKAVALQAYYEWMPIREPAAGRTREAIQRSFAFGDLATVIMVETRLQGRDEQMGYDELPADAKPADLQAFLARRDAPGRKLLGVDQEIWLSGELKASVARGDSWQVLGNQVVMARVRGPDMAKAIGKERLDQVIAASPPAVQRRLARLARLFVNDLPYNLDAWDGYPQARERVYSAIRGAGARPIVLAGDSHAFWVNDLKDGEGRRVAAEFGATGVTSPGLDDALPGLPTGPIFAAQSDEVLFCDQGAKGFVLLTLTRDSCVGDLMAVDPISSRSPKTRVLKRYRVTPEGKGLSAPTEA